MKHPFKLETDEEASTHDVKKGTQSMQGTPHLWQLRKLNGWNDDFRLSLV